MNYPIKTCLISMQECGDFDLDNAHHKFWFALRVANVGTCLAVQAWNEHPIPGKSDL